MLEQLSRHSLIDLTMQHARATCTSTATTRPRTPASRSGQAIARALGDRRGIRRFGEALSAMDETLTRVVVDASNRPYLVWKVRVLADASWATSIPS